LFKNYEQLGYTLTSLQQLQLLKSPLGLSLSDVTVLKTFHEDEVWASIDTGVNYSLALRRMFHHVWISGYYLPKIASIGLPSSRKFIEEARSYLDREEQKFINDGVLLSDIHRCPINQLTVD
jgi:hypothetical protein